MSLSLASFNMEPACLLSSTTMGLPAVGSEACFSWALLMDFQVHQPRYPQQSWAQADLSFGCQQSVTTQRSQDSGLLNKLTYAALFQTWMEDIFLGRVPVQVYYSIGRHTRMLTVHFFQMRERLEGKSKGRPFLSYPGTYMEMESIGRVSLPRILTCVGASQIITRVQLFDDVLVDLVPLTLCVTPRKT